MSRSGGSSLDHKRLWPVQVGGSLSVPPLISRVKKWLNFAGC